MLLLILLVLFVFVVIVFIVVKLIFEECTTYFAASQFIYFIRNKCIQPLFETALTMCGKVFTNRLQKLIARRPPGIEFFANKQKKKIVLPIKVSTRRYTRREFLTEILYKSVGMNSIQHSKIDFVCIWLFESTWAYWLVMFHFNLILIQS